MTKGNLLSGLKNVKLWMIVCPLDLKKLISKFDYKKIGCGYGRTSVGFARKN